MYKSSGATKIDWLSGGSELGKLIATKDWSKTPLGPIESWPTSLRTTVSLCLGSNFPINIIWGPEAIQIYNDGYRVLCGDAHPRALGEPYPETWESAWPAIGGPFERARKGETSFLENQRMFLNRNGYLEETFFTFSLSPIRDEEGNVVGLFHPVTETTQTMLAQRRTKLLRNLSETLSKAKTTDRASQLMIETLGEYSIDLPFVQLHSRNADENKMQLIGKCGKCIDSKEEVTSLDFCSLSPDLSEVTETVKYFGIHESIPYTELVQKVFTSCVAETASQVATAFIVLGVSARLPFDEAYLDFLKLLSDAIKLALRNSKAYEDETERAESLARIDQVKTNFFSNVSHEFRTPLTLMIGPLEQNLAEAHELFSPKHREREELAYRSSLRLLKLVNSLLDFSAIEAGRMDAAYVPTDLAVLTADLSSVFRSAIEDAGLTYEVSTPDLGQLFYVDPDMWEKIILNLLSNAFKFTLKGSIFVELKIEDGVACLRIRDTGIGIPANEFSKVFERFHRIEGGSGRTHEGTGIGLALVQELVKLQGGTISVSSQLGLGTEFLVRIPSGKSRFTDKQLSRVKDKQTFPNRIAAYADELSGWKNTTDLKTASTLTPNAEVKKRVLFVDDNSDMREYVKNILLPHWDVETQSNGELALASAIRSPPNLILSDIMMPKINGYELIGRLKENAVTRTVPVILLSARVSDSSKVNGLAFGADDYLTKPFSANELVARVRTHINLGLIRAAANAQRNKMFSILMQAPIAMCVLDGPEHIFILSNPEHTRIVQRNVLGKKVRDLFTTAEAGPFFEMLDEVYQTGHAVIRKEQPLPILNSQGQVLDCFVDLSYHALRDLEGKVTGVLAISIDVTERVIDRLKVEELSDKVLKQFRDFDSLLASVPDHMVLFDSEGRYKYCNLATLDGSGLSLSDVIGKKPSEVHNDMDELSLEKFESHLDVLVDSDEPIIDELIINTPTGPRTFEYSIGGIKNADNQVEGFACSSRDVTDRSEYQTARNLVIDELKEERDLRETFVSTLTHDLRTPITSVKLLAQMQETKKNDPDFISMSARKIDFQITRLDRMIRDLLDANRLKVGEELPLNLQKHDMQKIIENMLPELIMLYGKRFEVDSVSILGVWDSDAIQRIVENLIGNAVKYGKVNSTITLRLRRKDDFLTIEIHNEGIPISIDDQVLLFKQYSRSDSAKTGGQKGWGLGLALVKGVAEAHGGVVKVVSDAAHGTSFFVEIPISCKVSKK